MTLPATRLIAALALLLPICRGFSVVTSNDAAVLANAIFNGPGITVVQASLFGNAASSGTFADGLGGIGSGAILTTGLASSALGNPYPDTALEGLGSGLYCGANTFDANVLTVDIVVDPVYSGVQIQFIMATVECVWPSKCPLELRGAH